MPKLVKNNELLDNPWQEASPTSDLTQGCWLLSLDEYIAQQAANNANLANLGILVPGESDSEILQSIPLNVAVIAIKFATFADGRGFSLARSLREHYDYSGDLRATGYYLPDQVFYLTRCGFTSFDVPEEIKVETLLDALKTFSVKYQAAIDEPQPLFRRRS